MTPISEVDPIYKRWVCERKEQIYDARELTAAARQTEEMVNNKPWQCYLRSADVCDEEYGCF